MINFICNVNFRIKIRIVTNILTFISCNICTQEISNF